MSLSHRALVLESAGSPMPVVKVVETGPPGPGEALVRVKAAALNHRDVWIAKGLYADIRLPAVVGSDGAGVVEQVGPGVDAAWVGRSVIVNPSLHWGGSEAAPAPGWRILGMPDAGTFAELVRVPAENLAPVPAHLSLEEAAALPLAGLTAYRAMFSRGGLKAGETVLLTGAGGGVAQFLFRFALATGAKVFVTSGSPEKLRRAREAGAAGGADYRQEGWEKALAAESGGFDLIVDSAGGPGFGKLVDLAKPGSRLVFFGATAGNPPEMPQRKVYWKQINLLGSTMGSPSDFAGMLRLVEEKGLRPTLDRSYPFERGAEAFRRMDAGEQYGKIILSMGGG
jgi:NADPH:quinone reductase-like Zn-dependent oxidoreductase